MHPRALTSDRSPMRSSPLVALLGVLACAEDTRDATGDGSGAFTSAPSSSTASIGDATTDTPGSSAGGTESVDAGDDVPVPATTETTATDDSGGTTDAGAGLEPPAGASSGGAGGGAAAGDVRVTARGGITYRILAPSAQGATPLLVVFSGTEGGATMTNNLLQVADATGCGGFVIAVLDGVTYNGSGEAGAFVLDEVRSDYDIDNDRTYLLSESAGTTAGLELGLQLRQSWFAAYWANDVNASLQPAADAGSLGFAPLGNAGPGGDFVDAHAIVDGMDAAGYRTPEPSPYDGPGAGSHGDVNQFLAALQWFPGKSRQ
jgi:hypothetical protein